MTITLPQKDLFSIPEGMIYLDGNSLGPLAKSVPGKVATMIENQWGTQLIKGWNDSQWMSQPASVGDTIAKLIGAAAGSVVMGDTLSIKVYQALAAALAMRPERKVILSDSGNFPTDLYMAEGLIELLDNEFVLKLVDPEAITQSVSEDVAVVMLTQVDYRTGRLHDMASITSIVQDAGAVMLWDLAHSAGALPVALSKSNAEMAVGCTYKYLNGGPGAPAFIYLRPDLIDSAKPALSGWLGHDAPFAFDLEYRPAPSIEKMRVGTPPVMQMAALEAALEVWQGVDMEIIRQRSIALSEYFIRLVEQQCSQLQLISPRNAENRGSQVSFAFEHGYSAMRALIDLDVIGDFRAPNVMRFGITPLYLDESDIDTAVERLTRVLDEELWRKPEYQVQARVT